MTIFLELAKIFLNHEIEQYIAASHNADQSLTNRAVGFFTFGYCGRDKTLSESKRDIAIDLKNKIEDFVGAANDNGNYNALCEIITAAKTEAASQSKAHRYHNEGTFGPAMQQAVELLTMIYNKVNELRLLNVDHIQYPDPYNIFCFHQAHYCIQRLADARKQNSFRDLINNPQISRLGELAQKKESLFLNEIQKCNHSLNVLARDHGDYMLARRNTVLTSIGALQRANEELCKEYGFPLTIPIPIPFFMLGALRIQLPTLQPGTGFLGECLSKAKMEIDQPVMIDVIGPEDCCALDASEPSKPPHVPLLRLVMDS